MIGKRAAKYLTERENDFRTSKINSDMKYKEQLNFYNWAVKPDQSTFEALDQAVTSVCSIVRHCLRINREYGKAHEEAQHQISIWKGHHMVTM